MTSTFHNFTDAALADEIGALDREAKDIKKRLDAAKAEFKTRKLAEAAGERYSVKSSTSTRWSLNAAAIKRAMPEAWVTAHSSVSTVTALRIGVA